MLTNQLKSLALAAGLAVMSAGAVSAATVIGVANPVPNPTASPNATEEANLLSAAAGLGIVANASHITGYFIPTDGSPIDISFDFNGVAGGDSFLQVVFEDLDLPPENDPTGFFESLTITSAPGTAPTPIVYNNVGDNGIFVAAGGGTSDQALALEVALGPLAAGNYTATLQFTVPPAPGGGNTPEFLIAAISSTPFTPVPLPAGVLLMGTALAGFGVMRRKQKRAA